MRTFFLRSTRVNTDTPIRFSRKTVGVLALLLVIIILAFMLFPSTSQTSNRANYANVSGTFHYSGARGQVSAEFVYHDSYFAKPASSYSPSLATMSCNLALSTFNVNATYESSSASPSAAKKKKKVDPAANARALLKQLGFTDIEVNPDYSRTPTRDTIGVIVGHKKLSKEAGGGDLLVVAVRGGGYKSEWASNFNVGTGSEHEGFSQASKKVIDFVDQYRERQGIKETKMWIVGYSRGGAVAGLTAYKLLKAGEVKSANLYAYTFEAPASVRHNLTENQIEKTGIWNIVNPADLVPRLPLSQWGYTRPGRDILIPDVSEEHYGVAEKRMRQQLRSYDPEATYDVTNFSLKDSGPGTGASKPDTQSVFLDMFANHLTTQNQSFGSEMYALPTAKDYSQSVQDACMYFAELFAQAGSKKVSDVHKYVWEDITDHPIAYAGEGVVGIVSGSRYENLVNAYARGLDKADITYDKRDLEKAVKQTADFLLGFALSDPAIMAGALENSESLSQAHDASVTLAWVRAADHEFAEKPIKFKNAELVVQ